MYAPSEQRLLELEEALANFATVWGRDADTAYETGTSFTCTEMNALVDLLKAGGHNSVAEMWLTAHAQGDDEGDEHFALREASAATPA